MADHAGLVGKVEETVRYQYELHGRLVRRLNEKMQGHDLQEMPPAKRRMVISHSLYLKNCRAIHSSYELVLGGKISACFALLRDIHEAVLAQYYIGLCGETEFSRYAKLHQWERAGSDHDFTGRGCMRMTPLMLPPAHTPSSAVWPIRAGMCSLSAFSMIQRWYLMPFAACCPAHCIM